LYSLPAAAGFIELSATGSVRENAVDEDNSTTTRSVTGSLAYYFYENSAIQISYTEGFMESEGLANVSGTNIAYDQVVNFQMTGLDFILSGGGKNAILKPYLKAGGAYQTKRVEFQLEGSEKYVEETDGTFITYGLGFKLQLTKNWAIKAGYDGWTGPVDSENENEEEQTDTVIRAGISFIF
tara:strand:+ start:6135 stop:6680 length:546 start_codon:yes stop_codon:yes gene_type:complete